MNAKRVAAAEGVILAAMQTRRTAAGIAVALESACLLQSPESAAEARRIDQQLDQALRERDEMHDVADRLALAVAPVEVIGEHSSHNDPWANALDLITPMADVDRLRVCVEELKAERHSTNEALDDAIRTLRVQQGRIAELETRLGCAAEQRHLMDPLDHALEALAPRSNGIYPCVTAVRVQMTRPQDNPTDSTTSTTGSTL